MLKANDLQRAKSAVETADGAKNDAVIIQDK